MKNIYYTVNTETDINDMKTHLIKQKLDENKISDIIKNMKNIFNIDSGQLIVQYNTKDKKLYSNL